MNKKSLKKLRTVLLAQLPAICHICGKHVSTDYQWPHPKAATLDHLIPMVHGGLTIRCNLALAHHECNGLRGTAPARMTGSKQRKYFHKVGPQKWAELRRLNPWLMPLTGERTPDSGA